MSGQFDKDEVQKLAAELFGDWKTPSRYERILNPYHKVEPVRPKIETPGQAERFFIAGEPLKMSDEDPDYAAMVLANYMFRRLGRRASVQSHPRARKA